MWLMSNLVILEWAYNLLSAGIKIQVFENMAFQAFYLNKAKSVQEGSSIIN